VGGGKEEEKEQGRTKDPLLNPHFLTINKRLKVCV
jgi:hypothetical protein